MKVEYSFSAGYDYSVRVYAGGENFYVDKGESPLSSGLLGTSGQNVQRTIVNVSLPKGISQYDKVFFNSSSLNAKLYIYSIKLIK